jgi:hypothetical protein
MAAGGERKVLGNGSGDYNKDYIIKKQFKRDCFSFLHTNITLFRNVGKTFLGFADGRAANNSIAVDSMMSRANTRFALTPYHVTRQNNTEDKG